jgi:polysaccharide deacetylase family protein (PEP-CTERM system associated)
MDFVSEIHREDAALTVGQSHVSSGDVPLNALTVDVEDYYHVAALARAFSRADWETITPRVKESTERLLDIFDDAAVCATFFVLGWVGQRFPELVREIHRRGHEVASHGLNHTLVYEQTPEEFRKETAISKDVLEQSIGARVRGYRAASYSITKDSTWALDIIAESGFDYDSSVFPVYHDLYGIPGFPRAPHRLVTPKGLRLVEFPPTTVRLFGANLPAGGGGYFRLYPYSLTRYLLMRLNRTERSSFIFYLHPWEIDPEQPRVRAGLRSSFRHYMNLHKTEGRLRRLLRDFKFATALDVLERLALLST